MDSVRENSIFLDTFSYRLRKSQEGIFYNRWYKGSYPVFSINERKYFLFNILSSILIHDKIYIKIDSIEEFIELLNICEFETLLDEGLIKIIDDQGAHSSFMVQNNGKLMLMNFSDFHTMKLDEILKRVSNSVHLSKWIINKIEQNITNVKGSWLGNLAEDELLIDLSSEKMINDLGLTSTGFTDIAHKDSFIIHRLNNINRGLIYQNELNINSIHIDAFAQELLLLKVKNHFKEFRDPINLFKNIVEDKEIPDFSDLYIKQKICLEDILKLRNNFNGRKFRDWFFDKDYNRHQTYNELLTYNEKSIFEKLLRMTGVTILGLIPIVGYVVSIIDSFIIDKIIKSNWHPNLFLDKKLKKHLDKRLNTK